MLILMENLNDFNLKLIISNNLVNHLILLASLSASIRIILSFILTGPTKFLVIVLFFPFYKISTLH